MRIQYVVTETQMQEIKDLMDKCGLATKQSFFENAEAILRWAISEKENGRRVFSDTNNGEKVKEFVLPMLMNLTSKKN